MRFGPKSFAKKLADEKMCETNAKRSKLSRNRRDLRQIASVLRQFWRFCISFAPFFIGEFFCEGFSPKSHQKDKWTVIVFTLECHASLGQLLKQMSLMRTFSSWDTSCFVASMTKLHQFCLANLAGQLLQLLWIVANCHKLSQIVMVSLCSHCDNDCDNVTLS